MKCEKTWHGTYYYPENDSEKKLLKRLGLKEVVSGIGQGGFRE